MSSKSTELLVGLNYGGKVHLHVDFLPTNGIAEKVFAKKLQGKPFTWQARVVSVATKNIGDISIGIKVRENFIDDGDFDIPDPVLNLTVADLNTLLVEVHRKLWQSTVKDQEFLCKYCTKKLKQDIDLNKIELLQEDKDFLAKDPDLSQIVVYLKEGFRVEDCKEINKREEYDAYKGVTYNKITFRNPLVKDAIVHEAVSEDSVVFWRRVAHSCFQKLESVENPDTAEEKVIATLPATFNTYVGLRFYDLYLDGTDLKAIRSELTEYLPTLPFFYMEQCPCDRSYEIPHVMEASGFFSV